VLAKFRAFAALFVAIAIYQVLAPAQTQPAAQSKPTTRPLVKARPDPGRALKDKLEREFQAKIAELTSRAELALQTKEGCDAFVRMVDQRKQPLTASAPNTPEFYRLKLDDIKKRLCENQAKRMEILKSCEERKCTAGMRASYKHWMGEDAKALEEVNLSIRQEAGTTTEKDDGCQFWTRGTGYRTRALVRHALGDDDGAFADLEIWRAYYAKTLSRNDSMSQVASIALSDPTAIAVADQAYYYYRGMMLFLSKRYDEASEDLARAGDATWPLFPLSKLLPCMMFNVLDEVDATTAREVAEALKSRLKSSQQPTAFNRQNAFAMSSRPDPDATIRGAESTANIFAGPSRFRAEMMWHLGRCAEGLSIFDELKLDDDVWADQCRKKGKSYSNTRTLYESGRYEEALAELNARIADYERLGGYESYLPELEYMDRALAEAAIGQSVAAVRDFDILISLLRRYTPQNSLGLANANFNKAIILYLNSKPIAGAMACKTTLEYDHSQYRESLCAKMAVAALDMQAESPIKTEIEHVESLSEASPLPVPIVSDHAGNGPNVSRTLDNRTAYAVTVLLTGPTDKRIVLPPRTSQTFEIPAGRYKIAARLLNQNFPPLFAVQDYTPGHDYKSEFVDASVYDEPDAALVSALQLVVDSAQDDFADVRAERSNFTGAERWDVLVALPGFDKCFEIHEKASTYARDRFWYNCEGNFQNFQIEEKYRQLVAVVERSTGWPSTDNNQQSGPGKIFNGPGCSIHVQVWFGASLSVAVFPGYTRILPQSGTNPVRTSPEGENLIQKEVERIESAVGVSPLADPLVSDRAVSGTGASRTVDNQTAHLLVMLMAGPTDKRIVLPPRTKQTFEVPSGRYKVAARLLAPDFPTLFAIQEYASGHDYRSDFVIEPNLITESAVTSPSPASTTAARSTASAAYVPADALTETARPGSSAQVWVNLETKVYHEQDSRFYGKTKKGRYMGEADAIKAGYRAAKSSRTDQGKGSEGRSANTEDQMESDVRIIELGGESIPLSEPLVSEELGSLPNVTRIFDNRTPYVVTLLLTGPVKRRISLPAGASEKIVMPAGRYKVAARLLAPDFPPLFGVQEYVAGHDYRSEFVVQ